MSDLRRQIDSIALFRGLRYKEPVLSLCDFLLKLDAGYTVEETIESYGNFVSKLYELRSDCDLAAAIWDALEDDMNPYLRYRIEQITDPEGDHKISTLMKLTAERELNLLTQIGKYTSYDFKSEMYYDGYLPDFTSSGIDFKKRYERMLNSIEENGYGIYARCNIFRIKNGVLEPVKHPDSISEEDLFCYERERGIVFNNMQAFAEGKSFSDTLLYGDAGTGKSSTVKAAARKFFGKGVRLVELSKSELDAMPMLLEKLSNEPLKFVLFIDDISFDADDERIGSLKSVIEGAATGRRKNIIICVTSNRRHLVKETFSSRENEVHTSDTIAEQLSLSERFGLRVLFDKPNKATYLEIAGKIAAARGIEISDDELALKAEQFAMRAGGRSARAARQFVDSL